MEEYREVRKAVVTAVLENFQQGDNEVIKKAAEAIAERVMDAVAENYRSITEIHEIVAAVREGINVQIAYFDPDEDEDEMVVKACW